MKGQVEVANVDNFSMTGEIENASTIVCNGSGSSSFNFENLSRLHVKGLKFDSDTHSISASDTQSFFVANVNEFLLINQQWEHSIVCAKQQSFA